ncbi:methylenetetrahydrofolate reductase [Ancylomarina sp. DW003]|nr:methylenetetrahydrofolate reductase [Ancylomarina sp. DW003]MDE5420908.1 methylenetetrahydrofolate reductase [Ancylomarina sp. DW003]
MKVIDHINQAIENKTTHFSFELLPPRKGNSIYKVFNTIDMLKEFDPKYINITSHCDEVIFSESANGTFQKKLTNKRPGTVAVAAAIKNKYKLTVVPHVICQGFTPEETENALIDLNFLDIQDLLLLKGDSSKRHEFAAKESGHNYAIDLIGQVNQINKGEYLDGTQTEAFDSPFSFGVAGYPEKHEEAPNLDSDIYHLKKKVDAGADYIVTQMFFDNQKFFEFEKKIREAGITVPLIPGIKPISALSQLNLLPQVFKVDIPEALAAEVRKCKTNEQVKELGTEWGIHQSKELIKHGVPSLHFYSFMASNCVRNIAKEIF